jgi:outer membrane lipoprotein-sorting protein
VKFLFLYHTSLLLSCTALPASAQTAKEIISLSEEKMRGKSSEAILIIRTIRPGWSREMSIKAWMKGSDHSMILISSPARDKGIVFLKRGKEVWNWMPTIEKTIKLPPSMMSQSWMGTDFTNDDLVKESSILTDYTHSFSGDTVIDGRSCHKITLIPKSDAAVVWGRLITCIDKERLIQLHTRFYDENNELVNTMNATDVKMMDGRMIPTRLEMIPADKKNQRTEMVYEKVLFDRPIEASFFTTEQMRYLK